MSINSNMRTYNLQENRTTISKTGAKSDSWETTGDIIASIYQTSSTLNTQNVQYNTSTHVGYTYVKGLQPDKHRMVKNGVIYDVVSVDDGERMSILLLRAVDINGQQ